MLSFFLYSSKKKIMLHGFYVTNNINNGMFNVQFNAYDWRFRSMNSIKSQTSFYESLMPSSPRNHLTRFTALGHPEGHLPKGKNIICMQRQTHLLPHGAVECVRKHLLLLRGAVEGADKKLTHPSLTDYTYIHVNEAADQTHRFMTILWKY